jgi:hypothetical protein
MSGPTLEASVKTSLPLKILEVQWNDPTLALAGESWSLSLSCPWRVIALDGIKLSWSTPRVEDQVWDLVGAEIVTIAPQSTANFMDPVLELTGGLTLEVFSDSGVDTWTLRLPGLTLVGPLREVDWEG